MGLRNTADWENDEPMTEETAKRLHDALDFVYPGRVRYAVICCPVAVEKVIDNERDARKTLNNIAEAAARDNIAEAAARLPTLLKG